MPWDPLRDLRAWQDRLERLSAPHADSWAPSIDIYETGDRYVIAAELPGLAREQIELALEESRLTIRGQRPYRAAEAGGPQPGQDAIHSQPDVIHYHQIERGHGAFSRTFEFAEKIDVDAVSADLSNGILTVTLPKIPAPPVRKIEVR